jgi:hypothetical protein
MSIARLVCNVHRRHVGICITEEWQRDGGREKIDTKNAI